MNYKLISSKNLIYKVIRDLGLQAEEVKFYDFIEWISEGLKHIGAYPQFIQKQVELEIENHRVEIPCDFYEHISITSTQNYLYPNQQLIDVKNSINGNYNYKAENNTILFSNLTGKIILQYLAFPVDDEGFPLIPDNVSYLDALFWKIVYQLSIRGDIKNQQLANVQFTMAMWNKYCSQARADINMPTVEQMEKIKNAWLRLIPRKNDFYNGFPQHNFKPEIILGNGK